MPVVVFKQISPSRLLQVRQIRNTIYQAARSYVIRNIKRDFERTVLNWSEKPEFRVETEIRTNYVIASVTTDDPVYRFVEGGTEPHYIVPVTAGALAFSSEYEPKTTVGELDTNPGGEGNIDTVRDEVFHPGIEARNWEKIISNNHVNAFRKHIERALDEAIRLSGHNI